MLKQMRELPAVYALIVIIFVIAVIAVACSDDTGCCDSMIQPAPPSRVHGINENAVTEFTYVFRDGVKVRCIEVTDHDISVWCREPVSTTTTEAQ